MTTQRYTREQIERAGYRVPEPIGGLVQVEFSPDEMRALLEGERLACEGTDEFIKQAVFARLADLREQAPDMDEWEEIEVEVIKPVAAIIEMRFEGVELEALFDAAEQCDGRVTQFIRQAVAASIAAQPAEPQRPAPTPSHD